MTLHLTLLLFYFLFSTPYVQYWYISSYSLFPSYIPFLILTLYSIFLFSYKFLFLLSFLRLLYIPFVLHHLPLSFILFSFPTCSSWAGSEPLPPPAASAPLNTRNYLIRTCFAALLPGLELTRRFMRVVGGAAPQAAPAGPVAEARKGEIQEYSRGRVSRRASLCLCVRWSHLAVTEGGNLGGFGGK